MLEMPYLDLPLQTGVYPAQQPQARPGEEAPLGGGTCLNNWDGFLPAITLGITPTNGNGYAIDAWGNPVRYAITNFSNATFCPTQCFTTTNGIKSAWNGGIAIIPNLKICNTATGISGVGAAAICATGASLANSAVAVIYSSGKNGAITPTSNDEQANRNADSAFVSHTQVASGANEFDDLVIWLSPNIYYNRLITVGRLP